VHVHLSRVLVLVMHIRYQEGNFNQVQALGWLAAQLEDARKLCGIPQLNKLKHYATRSLIGSKRT